MSYTRNDLIEKLVSNEIVVTFNKLNGDERVMTCTLQQDKIPSPTKSDSLTQKKDPNITSRISANLKATFSWPSNVFRKEK